MEGWGKSGKDVEDNGSSYPNTRCLNNVKIVMGGGGWPVELYCLSPCSGLSQRV